MAIADDFSVAQNGNIRYTGATHGAAGAGYYTVIEFHRWLQDLADNAVASTAGNDLLDITDLTPSERQTDNIVKLINGYNIDQTASEHLYDGSIIQGTGGTEEIWDGMVVIAGKGMDLQIVQNGAVEANDFWNSIPNGDTFKGLNRDTNNGISHRFMIKVRATGADIDGRRLLGQTRVWGKTFSEFKINGTARGNNVMALTYADDLNNTVADTLVAAYSITNSVQGYNGMDVDNVGGNEYYYSKWTIPTTVDRGAGNVTATVNDLYEYIKYTSRQGTAATIYGINGELFRGITHEIDVDTPSITDFSAFEPVSWTGGTGQMLAINDVNAPTKMWIQLLTGSAPVDNDVITGGTSTATCVVNVTVTERTLSFPFCGVSTGSAIIGAYGFGIDNTDLTAADKVFDLTNTQITPPDNRSFSVTGLTADEDYVLVGPKDTGDAIKLNQFTLSTALSAADITSVVVGSAIPSDTPSTGTIRVADDNGVFRRLIYTSYTGSTFTVSPANSENTAAPHYGVAGVADFDSVGASIGNSVFISYIDRTAVAGDSGSISYTAVYSTPRSLYVRVRDGGGTPIKTFESPASFPGSAAAIRTSDA